MMIPDTSQQADVPEPRAADAELRTQVLSNLLSVSTYLVSVLDPSELLPDLAQRVVEVVPAVQAGVLWMFNVQRNQLSVHSSYGLNESIVDVLRRLNLRPGEGLPGIVLQRGESVLLDNRAYNELCARVTPRSLTDIRQLLERLPRNLQAVALPLRIGQEVIGVLELINLGARPLLSHPDLQVLQTFANLAAGAIKNAQLHAQMQAYQHRLEAFSAIGTVVSAAADLDELVDNVLDVVLSVVGSENGMLLLLEPSTASLNIGAFRHLPAAYLERQNHIPITDADCEEAVRYGQPIRRPLLAEGGEELLLAAGLGGGAYIPLLAGGTVVGVIGIFGDASMPERIDTQALMMMGSLISFAIANVQLYQDSQNERRKLSAVINSIAEGVVLCDRNGQLALANQTALELLSLDYFPFSMPDQEMSQMLALRGLDDAPLAPHMMPLTRALRGEIYHDYRLAVNGASGSDSVMSFTGAPVYGDAGQIEGAVVIFRDVTVSQKLERAKDDFLAVAAHELRSPLAAVRGYADLMIRREQRRGTEDGSSDMRGVVILGQQVGHMLRLVDNLLDVSRLDAGQFSLQVQETELRTLLEQVVEQLRPTAGERVLLLQGGSSEVYLMCDPLRIRQVFTNLLGNAIRYSPNRTRITIALSAMPMHALRQRHPAMQQQLPHTPEQEDGCMALVSIEDEGSGISPEQLARLFKRYVRGQQRSGEGLGLGLYLSREFVQRHHGAIWAESQEGRGTTFYVAFPLDGAPAANAP